MQMNSEAMASTSSCIEGNGGEEKESLTVFSIFERCGPKAPIENLPPFLMELGLIPKVGEYKCPKCQGAMKLWKSTDRNEGYRWVCDNKVSVRKQKATKCGTRVGLRTGTFFAFSQLPYWKVLTFASLWADCVSQRVICKHLGISENTGVDWASFCREVVLDAYVLNTTKLGGLGKVVEIDESKFGKRKYHRGHRVEGQWVFGGYERGTGRVFLIPVEDRGSATLVPIIRDWIEPGATIISDCWKAYNCLEEECYTHLTVNHSLTFKEPTSGAHTNSIESIWRAAKSSFSSSGRIKAHVPGNLARYMFLKRCRELQLDATREFLLLAGRLYDPCRPREEIYNIRDEEFSDDETDLF